MSSGACRDRFRNNGTSSRLCNALSSMIIVLHSPCVPTAMSLHLLETEEMVSGNWMASVSSCCDVKSKLVIMCFPNLNMAARSSAGREAVEPALSRR